MKFKLWYKNGDGNSIIDTKRDYARSKESIDEECGSLENYEKEIVKDLKTRKDILRYEVLSV